MKGIFTISLDFELHWGGFEKWPLGGSSFKFPLDLNHGSRGKEASRGQEYLPFEKHDYSNYFLNTRRVIPEMLKLFAEHEVHVTWATVGMLFHPTRQQLLQYASSEEPGYVEKQLSAYIYIREKGIGADEASDPFHFAPTLIQQIVDTPHQELATHTFAHYYCNEPGQNAEQFRADLKAAQRSAALFGQQLRSLVFPRNQFNDEYLRICSEEGITAVRSNPRDWFWHIESTQGESMWKRLNRGLDAYFPIGKENTYPISSLMQQDGYPVCIPASRLLRPYNPKEYFLNVFKVRRICNEMTRAAQAGQVYHLWWHPHNFGAFPKQSLASLELILMHFSQCRAKYAMESRSMMEVANLVLNERR